MRFSLPQNKTTRQHVENFLAHPAHALLILGEPGSGKAILAEDICAEILKITASKLHDYPYFYTVQVLADKSEITLDLIKPVLAELKLKTTGRQNLRRVIVIKQADLMNHEVQNTLLKALEEPPSDTIFIMTVSKLQSVLPTVQSRTQIIKSLPLRLSEAISIYSDRFPETAITKAWQVSGGAVELLDNILHERGDNAFSAAIQQAKAILVLSKFERLLQVDQLAKNAAELPTFLVALQKILSALQQANIQKNSFKMASSFGQKRLLVIDCQKLLSQRVNTRLVITKLMLEL